jgi:hypothetical protein
MGGHLGSPQLLAAGLSRNCDGEQHLASYRVAVIAAVHAGEFVTFI